jgi:hypothetical protein
VGCGTMLELRCGLAAEEKGSTVQEGVLKWCSNCMVGFSILSVIPYHISIDDAVFITYSTYIV